MLGRFFAERISKGKQIGQHSHIPSPPSFDNPGQFGGFDRNAFQYNQGEEEKKKKKERRSCAGTKEVAGELKDVSLITVRELEGFRRAK